MDTILVMHCRQVGIFSDVFVIYLFIKNSQTNSCPFHIFALSVLKNTKTTIENNNIIRNRSIINPGIIIDLLRTLPMHFHTGNTE